MVTPIRQLSWILILSFGLEQAQWNFNPEQGELAPLSQSAKRLKQSKENQRTNQELETRETVKHPKQFQPANGFLFSEIEDRHFSDFLVELYIQSQASGFPHFIEFLGLTHIVTEENCQKLILGQAGPGHYLTLYLADIIPPAITDRETFLRKAQAARERFSETVEISREAYERAKANLARQPIVRLPEISYASLERSHTTSHPFYQAFRERISKLLSNTQGVTVEAALIKVAEGLNLHPWMLQGYMPLRGDVAPLEIASRLTRLLYDTPEYEEGVEVEEEIAVTEEMEKERVRFLESAIAFFSESRGLDLANAQVYGVWLSYDGMLSAVMDYLNIDSQQLKIALARAGREVTVTTVENWKTGRALPQQESTGFLTAKVLGLQGKHMIAFLKKAIGIGKRAPDPKPGYLTVAAFIRTERSNKYRLRSQEAEALYHFLTDQLPADHPMGELFEARDPRGEIISIMIAGRKSGNFLHAYRDHVFRSLEAQGKIRKTRQRSKEKLTSRKMLTEL